jgi:hypothetical protein
MAREPFTSLPVATSLDGSEVVPIVQGGTSKRTTTGNISTFPATTGTFVMATDQSSVLPESRILSPEFGVTTVTDAGAGSTITVGVATNGISNGKLRQSAALSVVGNASNVTANVADISAASNSQILRRNGVSIGFGSIDLSQAGAVGSSILQPSNGGTGINNGASTLMLGGSLATVGAFPVTLNFTGSTNVTFPTSGTLATTAGPSLPAVILGDTLYGSGANTLAALPGNITTNKQYLSQTGTGTVSAAPAWSVIVGGDITGAALTAGNDTNVTLTLGGTPATALLRAASITAGWTGQLSLARGGTNANLTASNGGIFYSTASAGAILAGTATAGQIVRSGASAAPTWSTATYPATAAQGTILAAGAANTIGATATPTLGIAGTTLGTLTLAGNTSGLVTIQPQAAAGTYNFNVPTGAGTSGQPLLSGGGGASPMTFGTLGLSAGGTNASLTASNGGLVYSTASALAVLNGTATANQIPLSGANTAPSWSTATYPATSTAGTILASAAANVVAATATPTLGVNGGTGGQVTFSGSTSGSVALRVAAAAGTGTVFQLPSSNGVGGQVLSTDGSGNTSWIPTGGTGTVTSITPGSGTTSTLTATAPGSAITTTGTLSAAQLVNAQTGTSYAIVDSDRAKLITASNAAAQAYTIAQAGAASAFQAGWYADVRNNSANLAGIVTITPTTSTIGGASTYVLNPGKAARIVSDGTNYQIASTGGTQTLTTKQVFTSGTSATYTTPTNCTWIRIRMCGGGGGGANATAASAQTNVGSGGGGGGYVEHIITSPAATYTYSVGASGAAQSNGGDTTFSGGALTAGGGAGTNLTTGAGTALGRASGSGVGGSATNGNVVNIAGSAGWIALRYSGTEGLSAPGGNSFLGYGGGQTAAGGGASGGNYGGGGGGSISLSTTPATGGVGGSGILIVEEYYN